MLYNPNSPNLLAAVAYWGEINEELKSLKGKTDSVSLARFDHLIEESMWVDMNCLGPMKEAMKKGRLRHRKQ